MNTVTGITTAAVEVIGKCRNGHVVTGRWSDRIGNAYLVCGCGKYAIAKGMTVKLNSTKCGGRCTSSFGPVCNCSCGGENHGSDHQFRGRP